MQMLMKGSELTALPNTAAGTALEKFISAYNQGNIEAVTNFISRYYADPLAERGPKTTGQFGMRWTIPMACGMR
jgi:hypothetical protein